MKQYAPQNVNPPEAGDKWRIARISVVKIAASVSKNQNAVDYKSSQEAATFRGPLVACQGLSLVACGTNMSERELARHDEACGTYVGVGCCFGNFLCSNNTC